MSSTLSVSYVLYCLTNGSKGCDTAIRIVDGNLALKKDVHVQDIKLIDKPPWLRGVPVLAKIATKEIWEGSAAIDQLHYLSGYYSALSVVSASTPTQPWNAYQTNLMLPAQPPLEPATLPTPSSLEPVSLPPSIPSDKTPSLPPRDTSLAEVPPPPMVVSPSNLPPSSFETRSSARPSSVQEEKDPNAVQPLPPPDDQRPPQELNLPPPPMNFKKEISPPVNSTPTITPEGNSNSPSVDEKNTTSVNIGSKAQRVRRTMVSNLRAESDSEIVPEPDASDHVSAVLFTNEELEKIQTVMAQPKLSTTTRTVNKRGKGKSKAEDEPVLHIPEDPRAVRTFNIDEKPRNTIVDLVDPSSTSS